MRCKKVFSKRRRQLLTLFVIFTKCLTIFLLRNCWYRTNIKYTINSIFIMPIFYQQIIRPEIWSLLFYNRTVRSSDIWDKKSYGHTTRIHNHMNICLKSLLSVPLLGSIFATSCIGMHFNMDCINYSPFETCVISKTYRTISRGAFKICHLISGLH